jgi:hypothetical protein
MSKKIMLEGRRLDLDRAARSWGLMAGEAGNLVVGRVYLSRLGTWYMEVPRRGRTDAEFRLTTPAEVLRDYSDYLLPPEALEIASLGAIDWE